MRVWSLDWEDPLSRKWQPDAVLLPGKLHGQRSLAGYPPWGCKELDMAEHEYDEKNMNSFWSSSSGTWSAEKSMPCMKTQRIISNCNLLLLSIIWIIISLTVVKYWHDRSWEQELSSILHLKKLICLFCLEANYFTVLW